MTRSWWLLAALVAGCGGEAAFAPAVRCERVVAELEPWMSAVVSDGVVDDDTHRDTIEISIGFPPAAGAHEVETGTPLDDIAFLAAHIEREPADKPVRLRIADGARWLELAATVDAVRRARRTDVQIHIPEASTAPSPPRTRLTDTLHGFDMDRSTDLILAQVVGDCPRALDRARANESMPRAARLRVLAAELPGALRDCQCAADIPGFRSFFWSAHGRDSGEPGTRFSLDLAPRAGAELRYPADTRVLDVLDALQRSTGPIRLTVEAPAGTGDDDRANIEWIGGDVDELRRMPTTPVTTFAPSNDDQRYIRARVRVLTSRFRACYEREAIVDPDLAGTVVTHFTIGRDGRVRDVESRGVNAKVASCVAGSFRALQFNERRVEARIRYPLIFRRP